MKFLANKWIIWGVVPFFLILLWIGLTFSYIGKNSGLTILIYPHQRTDFINWKTGEILKGQKVDARFTARTNNLGIVAVRFNTYDRINSDKLIFRLKDASAKNWFYINEYLVNQFQPNGLFTFGFPIISNSKNKQYVFELESTKGKHNDAVALSRLEPVFVSKYEFNRHSLMSDKKLFFVFLRMKVINLLSDKDFDYSSFIYLLPFIFYLLIAAAGLENFLLNQEEIRKQNVGGFKRYRLALIPLGIICIDILFISDISEVAVVILLSVWVLFILYLKMESRANFVVAIVLLALCPFLLMLSKEVIAEKAAMWAYLFLVVGVLQMLLEVRRDSKLLAR